MLFLVDSIEFLLQLHKHVELGLAHEFQHGIAGVLRGNFQSTADMPCD